MPENSCSPLFIQSWTWPWNGTAHIQGGSSHHNPLKKTPHSIPTDQPNLDSSSWRRPSCVSLQWVKSIKIHHHTILTLVPVHSPRQTETSFPGVRQTERVSSFPVSLFCFWFVFKTWFKKEFTFLSERDLCHSRLWIPILLWLFSAPLPQHHIPVFIPSLTPVHVCGLISSGRVCICWCYSIDQSLPDSKSARREARDEVCSDRLWVIGIYTCLSSFVMCFWEHALLGE